MPQPKPHNSTYAVSPMPTRLEHDGVPRQVQDHLQAQRRGVRVAAAAADQGVVVLEVLRGDP